MTTPTPTSSPSARYNAAPGKGSAIVGKLIAVGAVVFVVLAGIVIYQYYQKVTSATVSATTTGTVYGCSDNPPSYLKPLSK